MVLALLAKSIATDDPSSALATLDAGLKHDPGNSLLWSQYWSVLLQDHSAQQRESWQSLLRQRLPFVSDADELRIMIELLKHQAHNHIIQIGYCRWDAASQVVRGWALNLIEPQLPCRLTLRAHHGNRQGQLMADAPVEILQQAKISSVGGFTVRLPNPVDALEIVFEDGSSLIGSPLACVPPMIFAKPQAPDVTVDVLVPVCEGREATIVCIKSLLACKDLQQTPHEIVVLDDASTDAVLVSRLQAWAEQGLITLVRRPANLGFIRNINRGMAMHQDRDVVWLNSDTRVTGNWLDRLRQAAYADERTATATPWSNDGEFMTLAGKHHAEPMPSESEQIVLDQLLSELALSPVQLVSGCGFCFYVKRKAIEAVGWLDEIELIDGYGEETDWCMRARSLGWQHVAATNLFVGHAGGQSFGIRKRMLAHHNNTVIRKRYPLAERLHSDYLRQDPLRFARETIIRARRRQGLGVLQSDESLQAGASRGQSTKPSKSHVVSSKKNLTISAHINDAIVESDSGIALIGDDLRQAGLVEKWLTNIRRVQQSDPGGTLGICFVTTQHVPGSSLLRRAGLVAPIHCPEGLAWKAWLGLLGVNFSVTHNADNALAGDVMAEMDVQLPVRSFEDWLNDRLDFQSVISRRHRSHALVKSK